MPTLLRLPIVDGATITVDGVTVTVSGDELVIESPGRQPDPGSERDAPSQAALTVPSTAARPISPDGRLTMRLTKAQKDEIKRMYKEETTNKSQIARVVGTTYHTVNRILKEDKRKRPKSPAQPPPEQSGGDDHDNK